MPIWIEFICLKVSGEIQLYVLAQSLFPFAFLSGEIQSDQFVFGCSFYVLTKTGFVLLQIFSKCVFIGYQSHLATAY